MSITSLLDSIQNPVKCPTFVHKNVEVKKTGRRATKSIGNKTIVLHEIVPFDSSMPQKPEWVQDSELFVVE